MADQITLNVQSSDGSKRTLTVNVENTDKEFINSVVNMKDNTITDADAKKILQIAARNGDYGILENCDLSSTEKLKLAENFNFGEYYDIKLSDDKKYFVVTVKYSHKDPTLSDIKSDFGIKDGVFVQKGEIPYGNENLIEKNSKRGSTPDGRNTDYNKTPVHTGETINIPVSEINISGSPRGFWGRLFKY